MTAPALLNPEPGEPPSPCADETAIDDDARTPEAGRYQIMPSLSDEESAALEKSIAEHGVTYPILVDEDSNIIDGHHRQKIAAKLGKFCPRRTVRDLTEAQKIAMTLTLNVDRRHLTSAQKRELLACSIKASPELSDREHGRRAGASDKTAGAVRRELQERAEIPHVEKRTDTTGLEQPATKPDKAKSGERQRSKGQGRQKKPKIPEQENHAKGLTALLVKNLDPAAYALENLILDKLDESVTPEIATELADRFKRDMATFTRIHRLLMDRSGSSTTE